jgi:hypothetical protein
MNQKWLFPALVAYAVSSCAVGAATAVSRHQSLRHRDPERNNNHREELPSFMSLKQHENEEEDPATEESVSVLHIDASPTTAAAEEEDRSLSSRTVLAQPRIVGGERASPPAYPWFVTWLCGGAMIAPDVFLTAAHCGDIFRDDVNDAIVWVGGRLGDRWPLAQPTRSEAVWQHPLWDPDSYAHDLMLVRTQDPVWNMTYIKLNKNNSYPVHGQRLAIMGYGVRTEGDLIHSHQLIHAALNYVDHCQEEYPFAGSVWPFVSADLNETIMFCATVKGGGVDRFVAPIFFFVATKVASFVPTIFFFFYNLL